MITDRQFQVARNNLSKIGALDKNNNLYLGSNGVVVFVSGESRLVTDWDDLIECAQTIHDLQILRRARETRRMIG